ncbi:tail fiber domain-containing protein [Bdellovibrio sp. ArHS]|uniref:tail fiber domain-containing protein n=1 Tax=Bdellovibrio sp. ArHS TaxID=1569284 RepID=UPI0025BFD1A6|nr:tail fiber domain-containing protein [Bdellovibrio sp. ArHS]
MFSAMAATGPGPMLTYEGVLTDSSDTPITTAQNVTFEILQNGSCILYRETQTVNPGSLGQFSVVVGVGNRTDATGNTLEKVFAVSGNVNCDGSSAVTAAGPSSRSLRISVGATVLTPDVTITTVPYAIQAQRLGDKQVSDFILASGTSTQANVDALTALYPNINALLNIYPATAPATGSVLIGNGATFQTGSIVAGAGINISNSASSIVISATGGGGTGTVTEVTAVAPLTVTNGTSTPALSLPQASGTANGYLSMADWNSFNSKLSNALSTGSIFVGNAANQAAAVTMSGDATLSSAGVLSLSAISTPGTYSKVTVDAKGRVTSGAALAPADIPGLPWAQITSGLPSNLAGYGITDAIKNAGGTPSIQSGLDLDRPTIGTVGRLYVATDTQKIYRDNGSSWDLLSSGISTGATGIAGGDLSGTYPNPAVAKIQGREVASTTPAAGNVLRYSGTTWTPSSLAMGDLTGVLPVAQGGTGANALSPNRLLISNGAGTAITHLTCAAGQMLVFDAAAIASCSSFAASTVILRDGNSYGSAMTIGTNDSQDLNFETVGAARMTVTSTGRVGIGTTNPLSKLDVTSDGSSSIIRATTVSTQASDYSSFYGYAARGTLGSPTHPLSGQGIAGFYGANAINPLGYAGMTISASEDHTGSAQGMALDLVVTKNATTTPVSGLRIANDGKVGFGTFSPFFKVHVSDDLTTTPLGITSANSTATGLRLQNTSGSNMSAWNIGQVGNASSWGNLGTLAFKHDAVSTPIMTLIPYGGTNGGVGINMTTFTGYALYVNGAATGTSWTNLSDRRYKKDIATLPEALNKVLQLRGVSFVWDQENFPDKKFQEGQDIGVIAQEVEAVYPEAVTTSADGYKSVAYSKLVAPLIESTHELYGMCKAQASQIASLERKIASLEEAKALNEERLQNLEKENAALKKDLELIKQKLGL